MTSLQAAIRRRIVHLNLFKLTEEDENASLIYKKILNLPLLPPDQIAAAYWGVKKEAKTHNLDKQFKHFFKYFDGFWLKLVGFQAFISSS